MREFSTRADTTHKHRVLDPMPTRGELDDFFENKYYQLVEQSQRALDINRMLKGGEEAVDQAKWFQETVHKDIADIITEHAPGKKVLEVGCGMGNLLNDLKSEGLDPEGVDIASEAVAATREHGITAYHGAFDTLVAEGEIEQKSFDVVVFNNVLELTFDPIKNLQSAVSALRTNGLVIVRAGNDFNPLQLAAEKSLDIGEWWVSPPEHINYLSFDAVESMLISLSVEPFHRQGEFPMELWLLLGFNYIKDAGLGESCHRRRVAMERSLPVDVRRKLYEAFGQAGIGRTMIVAGKLRE